MYFKLLNVVLFQYTPITNFARLSDNTLVTFSGQSGAV